MEREEMQGTRKITKWMGKNGQRCQVSAKSLVHQWPRGSVSSLLPRRAGGLMQLEHVGTCWNMLKTSQSATRTTKFGARQSKPGLGLQRTIRLHGPQEAGAFTD